MATLEPRVARLRQNTEHRTVAASTEGDAALAWLFCIGAVVLAWAASYAAGGSSTALPHAFYVPVIICAVRFSHRGALLISIAAGIVAGPLLPLDVQAGTVQDPENWLARMAAFVLIGQLTAYLSRHSMPSLTSEVAAHRFRTSLRHALDSGQIRLDYQPIVDLVTGELAGLEALARWDHPDRGVIGPNEFVTDAERFGCVTQLTRYVIDEACQRAARWRTSSLRGRDDFRLSVNVSAADVTDSSLCGHISDVLERTGLPNHWLHLEVTETALVDDVDLMVARLMDLRMLGIRLAIDDFGTGESSLGHLQQYPADVLKIDRIFVSRVADGEHGGDAVAHGIVALARAMGLGTVAEGIETGAQSRLLRDFGCPLGQGYLFSTPLDTEAIGGLLENQKWFRDRNLAHLQPSVSTDDPQIHPLQRPAPELPADDDMALPDEGASYTDAERAMFRPPDCPDCGVPGRPEWSTVTSGPVAEPPSRYFVQILCPDCHRRIPAP